MYFCIFCIFVFRDSKIKIMTGNSVSVIKVTEAKSSKEVNVYTKNNDTSNDDNDHDQSGKTTRNASYWNSLHGFLVLGVVALSMSMTYLIPRQNSILYPEYWYEGLFLVVAVFSVRTTGIHFVALFIFTKVQYILTIFTA